MRAQSATFDTSTTAIPAVHDATGSDTEPGPAEDSCRDLLEALRAVADPRHRRHQLVSLLAVAAAAVVAGARSSVAVGQWAAHAPAGVLAALEVRVHPRTGSFVPPSESTIRRTLQDCDRGQIDAVLGAWLSPRLPADQVITVDGTTLRGATAGHGHAMHLLAAMLGDTGTVLAQRETVSRR